MLTGLYSAASGMVVQEKYQDIVAQNLAGSQMPGFRREEMVVRSFPDVMLQETYRGLSTSTDKPRYSHAIGRVGTGAGVDWVYVDHTHGQMNYTGKETDIALFGDGFFAVETPDGMRFTRSGNFAVDHEGYLITQQGYYVLGQGVNNNREPSRIQVGHEGFHVNFMGEVVVQQPDANDIMRNQILDQLKITDFKNKDNLFREPGNLFRVEPGDEDNFTVPAEGFRVAQGYLESANTIPTTEMVKMMDSFRIHEASGRVIQALDQTLRRAVNDVGRPTG